MILELPESAAHVATDPKRVYYLGAGNHPACSLELHSFLLTRLRFRPITILACLHMLGGLRRSLVRSSSE
jgi:hypothetical protein